MTAYSTGTDRTTGLALSDAAHIQQSIQDILTTRIGARVLARDYGSLTSDYVDAPMVQATLMRLYADIYGALMPRQGMFGILGEPRFSLRQILVPAADVGGQIAISLLGVMFPRALAGDMTPANGGALATVTVTLRALA